MNQDYSPTSPSQEPALADDQRYACERLVALTRMRGNTSEAILPTSVLGRWSVPLLVGPSGGGKMYVCGEVARRLGGWPCCRWDIGAWIITANRSSNTTLEQILAFVEEHSAGCVVYLAGVDGVRTDMERNEGYHQAVVSEIEHFLDEVSVRPLHFRKRDGSTLKARVLAVVGGCFASLWGDAAVGGPEIDEAWKLADREPLSDPNAVANWLREHSHLPASILRRLAPEPLVLRPMTSAQAEALALRLHADLPPSLDGLGREELQAALQGPQGWRGVAALIERAWMDGYEPLVATKEDQIVPVNDSPAGSPVLALAPVPQMIELFPPDQTMVAEDSQAEQAKPDDLLVDGVSLFRRGWRLGQHLGIPSTGARLLTKARKLGLRNAWQLEDLAVVRGYLFPGYDQAQANTSEEVARDEFSDLELAAALLSPCLELPKRAICRGAWMLASLVARVDPAEIVRAARQARGALVVRHIALLAHTLDPQSRRWRDLILALPSTENKNVLNAKELHDASICRVLAAHQSFRAD